MCSFLRTPLWELAHAAVGRHPSCKRTVMRSPARDGVGAVEMRNPLRDGVGAAVLRNSAGR
eukprot:7933871-Alexandrium_andersonii.AAC.1